MATFDPDSDLVTAPEIPDAPDEPTLAIDAIQGNVLPGFGTLVQTLIGIRAADRDAAQRCLRWLLPSVSSLRQVNDARNVRRRAARADPPPPRPPSPIWTHVALSVEGLKVLGAPTANIQDRSFKAGMYEQASKALGDPTDPEDEGHVSHWKVGGSADCVPHILAIVAADDEPWVASRVEELKLALEVADAAASGLEIVYNETGTVLTDGPGGVGREHFGFRDGISTLAPRGRLSDLPRHFLCRRYIDPRDARAKDFAKPGQPLVWPGQFVFGYPAQDKDADKPVQPGHTVEGGYPWMVDGSLLVLRRLRQDVARFEEAIAAKATWIADQPGWEDITADRLAALLVGRWPNGTALTVDPQGPQPAPMDDRLRVNHFGFANPAKDIKVCDDPFIMVDEAVPVEAAEEGLRTVDGAPADRTGVRCPTFAHVRKVNPRDVVTDQGSPRVTLAAQVLRRGITFGPPFPAEPAARAADSGQRGLLFMAYQTSFAKQFELLTKIWMNNTHGPDQGLVAGHDLLVGQERDASLTATLRQPGRPDLEISVDGGWVVPTGGGYFFSPSIPTLAALAAGTIDS
jgi:deferrochelatase/peroxidase EfeB